MSQVLQSAVHESNDDGAFELADFGTAAPPDALTSRLPSADTELPAAGTEPLSRPPTYRSHSSTMSVSGRHTFGDETEPQDGSGISALPPVDRGFGAWAYLAGAFVIELMVWGPPFAFGSFLQYYLEHFPGENAATFLPLIGSVGSGLIYLLSLVAVPMFARYPRWRTTGMWVGLILCVIGLVSASFAATPIQLLATQGVVYSLGGTLLYFASSTYIFEWWVERRGLANGLILSGTGLGGVLFPLLIEFLLHKYGHKTALRVLAGVFVGSVPLALPFVKSRLPPAQVVGTKKTDWGFLKSKVFWCLFLGNCCQGLGNFAPVLYLPTFATDIGLSSTTGTLCLSMLNLFSAFGLICIGAGSDKNLPATIAVSTIGSAVAVFLVWGAAKSFGVLLAFGILFGSLAPSLSGAWPSMVSKMQTDPSQTLLLYALLVGGRGIGNVLTGPVSSVLLSQGSVGNAFQGAALAYGVDAGRWAPLLLFTGASLALSSLCALYPMLQKPFVGSITVDERRAGEEL